PAGARLRRPSSAGRATISEPRFTPSQTAILLDLALGTSGQLVGLDVPRPAASVPGRGGPERRRRPRPNGTGTPMLTKLLPGPDATYRNRAVRDGVEAWRPTCSTS